MVRISIRDRQGARPYRVMDYIRRDDGVEFIEVKDGCQRKQILLADLQKQLNEIQGKELQGKEA